LEAPVVAIVLGEEFMIGAWGDFLEVLGPGGIGADPGFEGLDLVFGKFFVGGHFQAFVTDGLEQEA
jgi:hypothetical protein